MRNFYAFLFVLINIYSYGQRHTVTIVDGYIGGSFLAGDTVHVWAREMASDETFSHWEGDVDVLEFPSEWYNAFIMPDHDVRLEAHFVKLPGQYELEYIQCAQSKKKVYHFMPKNPKGLVFLFHGTQGSADGWIRNPSNFQMFKDLMVAGYAVIVTEAEEVTLGEDTNMDGKIRWVTTSGQQFNNIDIRNIATLIDTFVTRGNIKEDIKKYAIGMSNGAAFSVTCSFGLSFDAAVPYCSSGNIVYINKTQTPTLWCMQENDDHPKVGIKGYNDARMFSDVLNQRGICSAVYLNNQTPIYPQLFARAEGISVSKSQKIFEELKSSGFMEFKNGYYYMKIFADSIFTLVKANPRDYPQIVSLASDMIKLLSVRSLMDVTHAGHKFFSFHNKRTLAFLSDPCSYISASEQVEEPLQDAITVRPNPVSDRLWLEMVENYTFPRIISIYNSQGVLIKNVTVYDSNTELNITGWPRGVYYLKVAGKTAKFIVQ